MTTTSRPRPPRRPVPDSSDRAEAARASRLTGYLLALLAATCWATGGLTAKWLFSSPSAETAAWPIVPLGIVIEPTTLSGARALTAFVLLAVVVAIGRPADLRVSPRDVPVPRGVRSVRPCDGPLHLLQDHLADQCRHRDPARVSGAGAGPDRRRGVHEAQVHMVRCRLAWRSPSAGARSSSVPSAARGWWSRRPESLWGLLSAVVLRRVLADGYRAHDQVQSLHGARVGARLRVAVLAGRRWRPASSWARSRTPKPPPRSCSSRW